MTLTRYDFLTIPNGGEGGGTEGGREDWSHLNGGWDTPLSYSVILSSPGIQSIILDRVEGELKTKTDEVCSTFLLSSWFLCTITVCS